MFGLLVHGDCDKCKTHTQHHEEDEKDTLFDLAPATHHLLCALLAFCGALDCPVGVVDVRCKQCHKDQSDRRGRYIALVHVIYMNDIFFLGQHRGFPLESVRAVRFLHTIHFQNQPTSYFSYTS